MVMDVKINPPKPLQKTIIHVLKNGESVLIIKESIEYKKDAKIICSQENVLNCCKAIIVKDIIIIIIY